MSNFEKLIIKMRAAQIAYDTKPTEDNLNTMEDIELEVDEYLDFLKNCDGYSFSEVKKYLRGEK